MVKPRYKITTDNIETALQSYCMSKAYTQSGKATIEKMVLQIATCPEPSFMDEIEELLENDLRYVHKAIEASSDPGSGGYRWSGEHTSQVHVLDFILAANLPSWKLMYNIGKTRQIVKYIQSYKQSSTLKASV